MEIQGGDPVVSYFPLEELQFIKTGKQRRAELSAQSAQDSSAPSESEKPAHRNLRNNVNGARPPSAKGEPQRSPAPKRESANPREGHLPPGQRPPEKRTEHTPPQRNHSPSPENRATEEKTAKKFHQRRKKRPGKPGFDRPKSDNPAQD